jgi:hypothetical protein
MPAGGDAGSEPDPTQAPVVSADAPFNYTQVVYEKWGSPDA